jgi:hypothetical protein
MLKTNQMLQKYNIKEDLTNLAPPYLSLSSPLSLISSLQLDELELELEDELEELKLDDHLEGSLLLLGWRRETLAFVLDVANEDGDGLRGELCLCLYSLV